MRKYTFEDIKARDLLIYNYIRGSHAYGLQKSDGSSDVDTAGVFIEPIEWVLGLGLDFEDQIQDERHDNVWYSLKKFMNMLLSSNPTVLESLFIPDRCILYEHPIMTEIKKHRDKFITKACFKPFLGYAYEQIKKARGLHKLFVNPVDTKKEPLDFAYTFYNQGSSNIKNWLEYRGLKQQYCGLVNIPNMHDVYGCYYDWGNFFLNEGIDIEPLCDAFRGTDVYDDAWKYELKDIVAEIKEKGENDILLGRYKFKQISNMVKFICDFYHIEGVTELCEWYNKQKPIGYKGMVGEDGMSNELRLSSVSKGEKPICWISYNQAGYSKSLLDYKRYQEWLINRNPERYKENKGKQFDRKNVAHAVRLMHMGLEIAKGKGFNVDRTNIDRDFIMNIRMGNTSYDEIICYLESKRSEMEEAMISSTLPDSIDVDFVNDMLIDIRKQQLKLK